MSAAVPPPPAVTADALVRSAGLKGGAPRADGYDVRPSSLIHLGATRARLATEVRS